MKLKKPFSLQTGMRGIEIVNVVDMAPNIVKFATCNGNVICVGEEGGAG